MGEIELTANNFEGEVIGSEVPVLVEFWAPWCSACRQLAPVAERIAAENGERLKVGKINVDEENALATRFGVRGIPKLMLFKNGKVIGSAVGFQSKKRIEDELLSLAGTDKGLE